MLDHEEQNLRNDLLALNFLNIKKILITVKDRDYEQKGTFYFILLILEKIKY